MADWKQITARIRRARGSKDPAGQLSLLFEKTKDAMVAFELGRHFEIVRNPVEAVHWYQIAFSRFRRGDWKNKSGDAIVRLGGELPPEVRAKGSVDAPALEETPPSAALPTLTEPSLAFEPNATPLASLVAVGAESPPAEAPGVSAPAADKKRRRGRRGGRNRSKKSSPSAPLARSHPEPHAPLAIASEPVKIAPPRAVDSRAIPSFPVEQLPEANPSARGRFGDPGLSSRLSLLEMQLRRLLTCPPAKLGHADHAPAGPGVFVLTDDDMTTYYHVEACDTLRIAISTLSRLGSTRRGSADLKSLLADHLGIPEPRVAKYLADHCVVRWLQLDEGAAQFAHFAIAVLRPILDQ